MIHLVHQFDVVHQRKVYMSSHRHTLYSVYMHIPLHRVSRHATTASERLALYAEMLCNISITRPTMKLHCTTPVQDVCHPFHSLVLVYPISKYSHSASEAANYILNYSCCATDTCIANVRAHMSLSTCLSVHVSQYIQYRLPCNQKGAVKYL